MKGAGAAAIAALLLAAADAHAAAPFEERHITLPEHDWAFDFGLGIAHEQVGPYYPTGPGFNVEGAVSVIDRLELGLRTGVRMGDDGRFTRADQYGRIFDRQTFGTGNDLFANPEFRITGALVRTRVFDLGLEGRAYLPFEAGTVFGSMFGLPLRFHIADVVRIDTGVYVPVIFERRVDSWLSIPVDVWIQATRRLWLGPMGGVRVHNPDGVVDVPLGFGLGYQILRTLDLKTQFLFPAINHTAGAQDFGFGIGIQVRIE